MKMNIFKKLPQAMVRVIATGALLVATALGSVAVGSGVAGATALTAATVSVSSTTAYSSSTLTVTLQPGVVLTTGAVITVTYPTQFQLPAVPTVTPIVAVGGFTTALTCTAAATASAGTLTVTTTGCALATADTGRFTVQGVTNGGAGTYPAASWTVATSIAGTNTGISANAVTLTGQLNFGTATAAGTNAALVQIYGDSIAATYTVSTYDVTTSAAVANTCSYSQVAPLALSGATCVVTGLTNGHQYVFNVTPSGNLDTNTASDALTWALTTFIPSGTLTVTAYSAGYPSTSTSADQEWISFYADGVATSYTVSAVAGTPCTVVGSPAAGTVVGCMVTGLADATAYDFTVTPTLPDAATAAKTVTATTTTGALSALAKAGTAGTATVYFAADGAANLYTVVATDTTNAAHAGNANSCYVGTSTTSVAKGLQSCVITGLTSGDAFTFIVTPTGLGTTSTHSAASNSITASNKLGTPTVANGPTSIAGTTSVIVTFTADGIASTYTVFTKLVSTGFTDATTYPCIVANTAVAPTGAQTCTVAGLPAGVNFTFAVTPSGNLDAAAQSSYSSVITTTAPFIPGSLNPPIFAPGVGKITVALTPDGYATNYLVKAYAYSAVISSTVSASCLIVVATTVTADQTCVIQPLAPGQYKMTVTPSGGTETNGTSAISSAFIVTGTALGVPTFAQAAPTAYGASAKISFTADGVASTYVVTASADPSVTGMGYTGSYPSGATCTVANTAVAPTGVQSCVIKGLAVSGNPFAPNKYWFKVTPSGNLDTTTGSVSATAWSSSTSFGTPSLSSAGSGTLNVSWTADGVATAYTAYYGTDPTYVGDTTFGCQVAPATAPTGAQSCQIKLLTNGTTYYVVVVPTGSYATAGYSLPYTLGINPLAVPTLSWEQSVSSATGSIKGTFTADGVGALYTVTLLRVSPSITGQTFSCTVGNSITPLTGSQSCTVTGLTLGTGYVGWVSASGNGDTSAQSPTSQVPVFATSYSAPGAPVVTATALTSTTVSVAWTAPVLTGGSVIGGYLISGTSTDGTSSLVCGAGALTAGTVVCTGAKPGTTYKISVYAGGPFGNSAAGTASVTTPAATLLTVGASFTKGTATLTASAKSALTTLVSSLHDGASITIRGWGATKALATARANAVASFIMSSGAAVHTTVIGIVSKASNAKVYQTA